MVDLAISSSCTGSSSVGSDLDSTFRTNATKILAIRMLQGYKSTKSKCPACSAPLMNYHGVVDCVVCADAAANNSEDAAPPHRGDGGISDDMVGAMLSEMERKDKKRAKRKKSNSRGREGQLRGRRESRNDDGDEDDHYLEKSILNITEDGQVELYTPSTLADESNEGNETPVQREAAESDFESEVETDMEVLSSINNAMLFHDDSVSVDSVAMSAPQESTQKLTQNVDERSFHSEFNTANNMRLLKVMEERINDRRQQQNGTADLGDTKLQSNVIHARNEEECYQKGREFASQIIQETNSILDDLISVEQDATSQASSSQGDHVCSIQEPFVGSGGGHLPSIMEEDHECSTSTIGSSRHHQEGVTSIHRYIYTPPTARSRKRLTINSISGDSPSTGGSRKFYTPAWNNSKKNSVFHEDDVSSGSSIEHFGKNSKPQTDSPEDGDGFLSELKHKSLLAKSTAQTRNAKEICMHTIVTNQNGDDISELDSPHIASSNTINADIVASPSTTHQEIQQRRQAANNRQQKLQQEGLVDASKSNLETIRKLRSNVATRMQHQLQHHRPRIDPEVPEDEKPFHALHSSRMAVLANLPFDEPGKADKITARAASGKSPGVNVLDGLEDQNQKETLKTAVPLLSSTPSSVSCSLASISESVQLQTTRIAQLEKEAMAKHHEAEKAAKNAKEALEKMMHAREVQKEKKEKVKQAGHQAKSTNQTPKSQLPAKFEKDQDGYSIASDSQYSHPNVGEDVEDSSTITDNDYTSNDGMGPKPETPRARNILRGRCCIPRTIHHDFSTPKHETPMALNDFRHTPPPMRVGDEEDSSSVPSSVGDSLSGSTYSTLESNRRRSRSHHDYRRQGTSAGQQVKQNLLLPTLNSPSPVPVGRRADPVGTRLSRSKSSSPRYFRLQTDPVLSQAQHRPVRYASRRPSRLISHSTGHSRVGYVQRPAHNHHQHLGDMRQYSPSLAARMTNINNTDTQQFSNPSPPVHEALSVPTQYYHYGGTSLTPKSLHEQERFSFQPSYGHQQVGDIGIHGNHTRNNFDSLSLAEHRTIYERMAQPFQHRNITPYQPRNHNRVSVPSSKVRFDQQPVYPPQYGYAHGNHRFPFE